MTSPHIDVWSEGEKARLWQLRQEQSHLKWDDWYRSYGFRFPGRTQAALSQQFWTLNKLDAKRRAQMSKDRVSTADQPNTTTNNNAASPRQAKRPGSFCKAVMEDRQPKEPRLQSDTSQNSPDGGNAQHDTPSPSFSQRTEDLLRSIKPQRAAVPPPRKRKHVSSPVPLGSTWTKPVSVPLAMDVDESGRASQEASTAPKDSQTVTTDKDKTKDPDNAVRSSSNNTTPAPRAEVSPTTTKEEALPHATSRPPSVEAVMKTPLTKTQCMEQTVWSLARFAHLMGEEEKSQGSSGNDSSTLRKTIDELESKVVAQTRIIHILQTTGDERLAAMEKQMEEMEKRMKEMAQQAAKDAKVMEAFRKFTSGL
ncbi:uncharacterized protein BDV14DRAFT_123444 [Aspergillus stella-maris]|uniref:uncharacterized protein n=1 Tax=Aspergillus stella-maris TaxID=1810926 RepID=UPI003CCE37EB